MGARVPVPDERMQRVIDMLKSTSPTSLLRASRKSRLTALARPLALNPPLRPARKAASALAPWHSIVWGVAEGATDDIASQGRPDESTSLPLASLAYSPRPQPRPNSDTGSGSDCNHTDVHGYLPTPPCSLLSRAFPFPRPGFLPTLPPLHSLLPRSLRTQ